MMQSVVDDSFDGIVIANQDGVIELFNPAAEKILKLKASQAIGTPVHAMLPSNRAIAQLYAQHNAGEEGSATANFLGPYEFTLETDDGEPKAIEMVVSSSRIRVTQCRSRGQRLDKTVCIYTFRDISERKKMQDAQQAALEEHATASRAKSEFLANMSHELRTPLNAIIGFSEIIKTEVLGPVSNPKYVDYAGDIYASGSHLLEIINDILDIAKIESGETTLNEDPVDLGTVTKACIRLVQKRADDGKLTIVSEIAEGLPRFRGDERKIKQIFSNLLSNAVKFTPEGGVVRVRCEADRDGGLVFTVQDTGIGIAPEHLDKAMQNFGQVDGRLQRKYEGTGLGLPMVKALTTLHSAEFELKSELGVGTSAIIRIPASRVLSRAKLAQFFAAAE
jgi:PAS domain S-box-containing protein